MGREIGKKIKDQRIKLRWSQRQAAEFLGVSAYQTVARWESGK